MSDKDLGDNPEIYEREMRLAAFLDVAKRIASDDAVLLSPVVTKVLEVLRKTIDSGDVRFSVLMDYLYDGFDLLRRLPAGRAPQGNLRLFREEWTEGDSPKCVVGSVEKLAYKKAIAALFNVWSPVPVGDQLFKIDEYPGTMLRVESVKTRNDGEPSGSFLIPMEDLLELMDCVEAGKGM